MREKATASRYEEVTQGRTLVRSGLITDGPHCTDPRHETPCPLPCEACKWDCNAVHFTKGARE